MQRDYAAQHILSKHESGTKIPKENLYPKELLIILLRRKNLPDNEKGS